MKYSTLFSYKVHIKKNDSIMHMLLKISIILAKITQSMQSYLSSVA